MAVVERRNRGASASKTSAQRQVRPQRLVGVWKRSTVFKVNSPLSVSLQKEVIFSLVIRKYSIFHLYNRKKQQQTKQNTVRIAKNRNRLPTEVVKSPPLEVFHTWLDKNLNKLVGIQAWPWLWAGGWIGELPTSCPTWTNLQCSDVKEK